jgi:hypothetical protein
MSLIKDRKPSVDTVYVSFFTAEKNSQKKKLQAGVKKAPHFTPGNKPVKERNSFFIGNSIPDPKLNDITAEEERRQKLEDQSPKQQNSFKAFDLQPADSLGNSRLVPGAQPTNVQKQPDIDAFKHLESPPSISEDKGSYGFNYASRAICCGLYQLLGYRYLLNEYNDSVTISTKGSCLSFAFIDS